MKFTLWGVINFFRNVISEICIEVSDRMTSHSLNSEFYYLYKANVSPQELIIIKSIVDGINRESEYGILIE